MIWYISPYISKSESDEKNIGGVYNKQISIIPDEDWVCIHDQDCCFLLPDTKSLIEEIITKGEYELYGSLTNRLGVTQSHQLYKGMISDDPNIENHIAIAKEVHSDVCTPTNNDIAGMLMLFRKSTWARVGGFMENTITFDRMFSQAIQKKAIMVGVYLFHVYRFGEKNPQMAYKHLLNK